MWKRLYMWSDVDVCRLIPSLCGAFPQSICAIYSGTLKTMRETTYFIIHKYICCTLWLYTMCIPHIALHCRCNYMPVWCAAHISLSPCRWAATVGLHREGHRPENRTPPPPASEHQLHSSQLDVRRQSIQDGIQRRQASSDRLVCVCVMYFFLAHRTRLSRIL